MFFLQQGYANCSYPSKLILICENFFNDFDFCYCSDYRYWSEITRVASDLSL